MIGILFPVKGTHYTTKAEVQAALDAGADFQDSAWVHRGRAITNRDLLLRAGISEVTIQYDNRKKEGVFRLLCNCQA